MNNSRNKTDSNNKKIYWVISDVINEKRLYLIVEIKENNHIHIIIEDDDINEQTAKELIEAGAPVYRHEEYKEIREKKFNRKY